MHNNVIAHSFLHVITVDPKWAIYYIKSRMILKISIMVQYIFGPTNAVCMTTIRPGIGQMLPAEETKEDLRFLRSMTNLAHRILYRH